LGTTDFGGFDPRYTKRIEYILEWNLLEKSVKRPFCCSAVSILQVYFTYLRSITLWALEHHFIENNIKRKPNYEIGWFHNWPMTISHRLYALQTMIFCYNYKLNDVFYSPNSFYKVYSTALKNSKSKRIV